MWHNKNEVRLKSLKKIISKQKPFFIMKYFIKHLCYSNSWKFLTFSFKQVFPALLSFSRSLANINIMLKERLNCFNDGIYCHFKSFICLLGYEHFTFHISRKIPWTLFNGCQLIYKISQENISKSCKSWIVNSWKL